MLIQKEEELEKLKGRSPALRKANSSVELDTTTFDSASKKDTDESKDKTKDGLNYDYLKNIVIKYLVY